MLPSHPQHEVVKKQMRGFGGMISFYVKGDSKDTLNFLKGLKVRFFCSYIQIAISIHVQS